MKNMFHKFLALALAACMICSFGVLSASAAGPYEDGVYSASLTMLHESKDQPSMCGPLFFADAEVAIKGENTTITCYVANPVPAFPDQGADGTVKNMKMTVNGVQYEAVSDMVTKPMKTFNQTSPLFGLTPGQQYPCQVLTFTIPSAELDGILAVPAKVDAYVNVVMNTDVVFRMQLTNFSGAPTETSAKAMQLTAEIVAPEATYDVVIPEAISLGTLSKEEDTKVAYTVDVTAENLGSGKVVVSAAPEGKLTSGENTLAYTNTFGTQNTAVSAKLNGAFQVKADDVAKAAAGNYTGTANFAIAYYAGK